MDQRIIDAIKVCTKKKIEVTNETDLKDDLELDSLGNIMFINEIEARFNINIEEKDFADIKTVGDIIEKLRGLNKC